MRIAFHGKGGAGKTTTTAGFVDYAASHFPFVLAVDADLNAHLRNSLGFVEESPALAQCFDQIMNYLKGGRTDIGDRPMLPTIPPSFSSTFVRPVASDALVQRYAVIEGNVGLMTVGGYEQRDISSTCYHEKLKSLMAVFHHMLDRPDELVVVDTIAGTDNISTSLSFAFDLNVFVVEPTVKSVRVYQDYAELVPQYLDRLFVIANKVSDADDLDFIKTHIPSDHLLGTIPLSAGLKRFEQNHAPQEIAEFRSEQSAVFQELVAVTKGRKKRDWSGYLALLRQCYELDCSRWYSEFHKCDLLQGIDADFSYEAAIDRTYVPGAQGVAPASRAERLATV